MNDSLAKAGFEFDSRTYDKDFENRGSDGAMIHDGARNRWKISLSKILPMEKKEQGF